MMMRFRSCVIVLWAGKWTSDSETNSTYTTAVRKDAHFVPKQFTVAEQIHNERSRRAKSTQPYRGIHITLERARKRERGLVTH